MLVHTSTLGRHAWKLTEMKVIMKSFRSQDVDSLPVLFSLHLFHLFPDLSEGSLSMYRKAIVENTHLTILAKVF